MATQVIGSLAVNNLLPTQARAAGTASFGPIAVPQGYSAIFIQIDLTQVTDLTAVFSATMALSTDGGVTFPFTSGAGLDLSVSGYVLNGSTITRAADDPLGPGPVRVFGFKLPLLHTESTTRQVQGTLTCSEAVTAGATVVAY